MAVQDGIDDGRSMIAVFEGGERGWLRIGWRATIRAEGVNVVHDVPKRVGPRFLVAAWQVRVGGRGRRQQPGILHEDAVGRDAAADPERVLVLLLPAYRRAPAVHFEPEVILVAGAHLSD